MATRESAAESRAQANRLRKVASETPDDSQRKSFLRAAEYYEKRAEALERKLAARPPKNSN